MFFTDGPDLFQSQAQGDQIARVAAAGTQATKGCAPDRAPGKLRAEYVQKRGRIYFHRSPA